MILLTAYNTNNDIYNDKKSTRYTQILVKRIDIENKKGHFQNVLFRFGGDKVIQVFSQNRYDDLYAVIISVLQLHCSRNH